MKILVTGGRGQLGRALVRRAGGHEIVARDVDTLDILTVTASAVAGFDAVINAAAYTGVDKAESERDLAFAINRDGAGNLARACAEANVPMFHVSTDYVFDGQGSTPYREDAPIAPINVYGASKAAGEEVVREAGGTIVRTSWLFGEGGPSFVHTMLRLSKDRPELRVVDDQWGCPTWADDLADGLVALAERRGPADTFHYCNAGETTWLRFAQQIIALAQRSTAFVALTTEQYPTPAKRPRYSVLSTEKLRAIGIVPPAWTIGLARVVAEG